MGIVDVTSPGTLAGFFLDSASFSYKHIHGQQRLELTMRKLWLPSLVACFFLAASISFLSYGWHLQLTLPTPRDGLEVAEIVGLFVLGGILFVGSTGYLGAVPGLEIGNGGFRTRNNWYGRFVRASIGRSATSCGAGYAFGLRVYSTLIVAAVLCFLLTCGVYVCYRLFNFVLDNPIAAAQELGIVLAMLTGLVVLVVSFIAIRRWLKSSSVYEFVCPPREQ